MDAGTRIFNVKVVRYPTKTEYHIYSRSLKKNVKKEASDRPRWNRDNVDESTGEIRSQQSIEHSFNSSLNRTINTIYEYSFANEWQYFFTFTFNPDLINRYDYDSCYKSLRIFLNNYKSRFSPDLKYLVVPEQHKDGAWHFHGLFANVPESHLFDSGHKSGSHTVYNFPRWKWGFSTATRVTDTKRVSTYITKYITKDLVISTKGKHRYFISKNLNRAEIDDTFINPDKLDEFKLDLMMKSTYTNEIDIPDLNMRITYIHIDEHENKTDKHSYILRPPVPPQTNTGNLQKIPLM